MPVVGRPLRLHVPIPRYRCVNAACEREVFAHNTDRLARRGASTTRRCARYLSHRLMIDRAAVARQLGLASDGTPATPSHYRLCGNLAQLIDALQFPGRAGIPPVPLLAGVAH